MNLRRIIFSYIKNSVLDLILFCSRSVLVLNIKTFSCSCSVLVREQEHVREHVPEQYACSFIPVSNIECMFVHYTIFVSKCRWIIWDDVSNVCLQYTTLFFCQYFGNYYLLLVQLGHLGGSNIYAIYDQFLMVMPNQL